MEELEIFISRIPDFDQKSASELIDFFAFFLQKNNTQDSFTASQIKKCFETLSLAPYSNIPSYLSRNTGSKGKYLKQKCGYSLSRTTKEKIALMVSEVIKKPVSTSLVDISIFDYAPYYLKQIAEEMIRCYDDGHYNATLVLMRKLVETLIIECFEKYSIDSNIKDSTGNFYYLSDLIPEYNASTKWNASRNIKRSLDIVKKYGNLSAHNRRFLAKKSDIDNLRFDLRQALQEIILTIDYKNKKECVL